jgi:hypothetical protein
VQRSKEGGIGIKCLGIKGDYLSIYGILKNAFGDYQL